MGNYFCFKLIFPDFIYLWDKINSEWGYFKTADDDDNFIISIDELYDNLDKFSRGIDILIKEKKIKDIIE